MYWFVGHGKPELAARHELLVRKPGTMVWFSVPGRFFDIDVVRRGVLCDNRKVLSIGQVDGRARKGRRADEIDVLSGYGEETQLIEDQEGTHRAGIVVARQAIRAGVITGGSMERICLAVLLCSPIQL